MPAQNRAVFGASTHYPYWVIRALVALTLAALILVGGVSDVAAGSALDHIRDFFGNVNRLLVDPAYEDRLPERLGAVRALLTDLVDFRMAAMLALGGEWEVRTPAEREEFARLFADLLQTSMFASIGGRARIVNGLSVTYIGELADRDGVTVATSVLMRAGTELGVGYRMTERNGRWKVYDVVLDGVSLVDNYRAQFQKVIGRSSYAGLVGEMRTRIAELGGPLATAAAPSAPITVVPTAQAIVAPRRPLDSSPVAKPPAVAAVTPDATPAVPAEPATVRPSEWTPLVTRETAPVAPAPAEPQTTETRPAPSNGSRTVVPVKPAVPRVGRGSAFWIQVGAFESTETLVNAATALRDQSVTLVTDPTRPLTRVMVGPFPNRATATTKVRELRARGYEAFIADAK
jgi:phospholipid transport system substrate-binding protein